MLFTTCMHCVWLWVYVNQCGVQESWTSVGFLTEIAQGEGLIFVSLRDTVKAIFCYIKCSWFLSFLLVLLHVYLQVLKHLGQVKAKVVPVHFSNSGIENAFRRCLQAVPHAQQS